MVRDIPTWFLEKSVARSRNVSAPISDVSEVYLIAEEMEEELWSEVVGMFSFKQVVGTIAPLIRLIKLLVRVFIVILPVSVVGNNVAPVNLC